MDKKTSRASVSQKSYIKNLFDKENLVANQKGTWQNWVYRTIPTPIDYLGIPGTKYNLGAMARRWDGKPQLDYDVGQLFNSGGNLSQIADYRHNLALDNPPLPVD